MAGRLMRVWPIVSRARLVPVCGSRFVSQTKPTGTVGSAAVSEVEHSPANESHGHTEVSPYVKNPDYHGFSHDAHVDTWNMRTAFFFSISVALIIGGTFVHYLPDHGMRQWARREAEKLIRQREADGLPLIDENYYDPSKIVLPSTGESE